MAIRRVSHSRGLRWWPGNSTPRWWAGLNVGQRALQGGQEGHERDQTDQAPRPTALWSNVRRSVRRSSRLIRPRAESLSGLRPQQEE